MCRFGSWGRCKASRVFVVDRWVAHRGVTMDLPASARDACIFTYPLVMNHRTMPMRAIAGDRKIRTIIAGSALAAATVFPVFGTPVAQAAPVPLSGTYSEIEPNVTNLTWTFAPCGPGCLTVTQPGAWSTTAKPTDIAGQPANNALGTQWQWDVMNRPDAWQCNGIATPGSMHFLVDPNSLEGWYAAWSTSELCPGSGGVGPDGFAWAQANNFTLQKVS